MGQLYSIPKNDNTVKESNSNNTNTNTNNIGINSDFNHKHATGMIAPVNSNGRIVNNFARK